MKQQIKNDKLVLHAGALFVYATLIVDLFRKFSSNVFPMPISTTMFRNIVYVLLFVLIMYSIKRIKIYQKLIVIGILFTAWTLISWLINWERDAASLYVDLMFQFVSRLLPAYYIGTAIVGREQQFIKAINRYQLLTLLYTLLILAYPELSATSYITISNNLLIPVLFALICSDRSIGGWLCKGIGLAGLVVIVVYGGRTSLASVLLAVALLMILFLKRDHSWKRIIFVMIGTVAAIVLLVMYDDIINMLLEANPTSRTLKLLARGEFLWTSNRDGYYEAALASFMENPLRVYGFLGDRFYYADTFGSMADNGVIATMYSHNSLNELMLNFGVIPGIIMIFILLVNFWRAVKNLNRINQNERWYTYIILFSSAAVAAFISSSWLNDVTVWLLCGSMFSVATRKHRMVSQ